MTPPMTPPAKPGRKSVSPPAKKGRKSPFSQGHKDWILSKALEWGCLPHMDRLREILNEGKLNGKLPEDTSLDSVRWVARTAYQT